MIFEEQAHWQQARLGKFTASEIHKLMQKGKSKSEYFGKGAMTYIKERLAEILTGQPVKELTGLNALEWGNAHEMEAVKSFQEAYKIPELIYYGGANPSFFEFNKYSGGSPDGITSTHIIEVKCPYNSGVHIDNLLGSRSENPALWFKGNRLEYFYQSQFNMMCCKKRRGYFVSYDPRMVDETNRLAIIELTLDEETENEISERIDSGANIIRESIKILEQQSLVLIAHHDPEANVTIVE